MRTLRSVYILLAAAAVLCLGLALGARLDLPLVLALRGLWDTAAAQHAAGESSLWYLWGIFAEALGTLPAYAGMPVLGWCMCCGEGRYLLARSRLRRPARFAVGAFLITAGCIAGSCVALGYFDACGFAQSGALMRILLGLCCAALILLWSMLSSRTAVQLQAGQALGIVWCGYSLLQCGVIQLMKAIWNRARFDDLLAAGDSFGADTAFTPWTQIPGSGGSSFPSGHTASAGVLLVLVLLCVLFEACEKDEGGWVFVGLGFAAAVGFGRMLIGRHYLSDVCMALITDLILLAAVLVIFELVMDRRPKRSAKNKS